MQNICKKKSKGKTHFQLEIKSILISKKNFLIGIIECLATVFGLEANLVYAGQYN